MTDLDHKRRQVCKKANDENVVMVIYTDPDDLEPKVLLDAPEHWVPHDAEIIEKHYPRIKKRELQ